jgi:hypothetical protein
MKRTRVAGIIASFVVLLSAVALLCMAVPAQNRSARDKHQSAAARNLKGEFAPRIIGRANSFIVNGRVVVLRGSRLGVETARGTRLEFEMDEQTTLLEANTLVSIATMDDITLRPADLRLADEVEVVAERVGHRLLARIVTRTAAGQPVARR